MTQTALLIEPHVLTLKVPNAASGLFGSTIARSKPSRCNNKFNNNNNNGNKTKRQGMKSSVWIKMVNIKVQKVFFVLQHSEQNKPGFKY